ncbi:hypothetical protein RFI_01821 [Reticulomyxa filosa]|uniref:PH domain-containing protein n=1 Tax=Reticulomyxa filosa TaxID=46433 RepID=X6PAT8_RETFI|nr:hypothetical protein RFI_01821 [Reticulomyxa filosa]|eukprot:ETO35243.1 hypothetical protein RFI_01821 [Reticulomyxa filosa]
MKVVTSEEKDKKDEKQMKSKDREEEHDEKEKAAAAEVAAAAAAQVESIRRQWLELQGDRMNLLTQQRQMTTRLHEQDHVEWRKRETKYQLMEKRVESMYQTSAELQKYMATIVKLQKGYEEGLHQIKSFAASETGTVREAAVAIESLQTNRYKQYEDVYKRVFQPAVESMSKFSSNLKSQLQYFKSVGGRVTSDLQQSRDNYETSWQVYERSLQDTLEQQNKGEMAMTDPFLFGKEFDHAQKEYAHYQNKYNEEMARLFRELVLTDDRRVENMKTTLLDYFSAEKSKAVNCVKMLEASLEYIKAIDRERDVNEFIHHGEDNTDHPLPNVKNIFDIGTHQFSKKTLEISNMIFKDVVRWGMLYRPGRIIAANWKPLFAIITKFGFFHLFQTKQVFHCSIFICLCHYIRGNEKDESSHKTMFTFEVIVPNTSYWSLTGNPTRYLFKCDSFEECVDWVLQLKKFVLK